MASRISSKVWQVLACSYCGQAIKETAGGAQCPGCGQKYRYTSRGALDLRLKRPKRHDVQFELGTPLLAAAGLEVKPLTLNTKPQVDFAQMSVPHHMTKELMSYFPKATSGSSLMLDLACGNAVHKELCERAGFEWVGVDYDESSEAAILADAHALPFANDSFECILSVAALHLFRFPFVMTREAHRVVKPKGVFLGTVAFLEPFHGESFYHHSHLGALNTLQFGGFTVERLAPSEEWTGLMAQASMGLFPRMPGVLVRCIVFPVHALHKLWWEMGRVVTRKASVNKDTRIRNTTGGFAFVAFKSAA